MMSLKRGFTFIGMILGVIVLALVALTSWYTVDESDQAVMITFGKADQTITEPGLHFKLPWPVQNVKKLARETKKLDFGFKDVDGDKNETKMITGDENIVLADLVVQWKITEPEKYLFNSANPEEILYDATSASLRSIIGSSKIDDALTTGKAEIEGDVRDLLTSLLEKYDIGISILAVNLKDVELPNEEVRSAFTAVTDARETMNTKINEAQKYENKRMNEAEGEKSAIISKAEGEKAARIEAARGSTAVFNSLYKQYKSNPDITRERLTIETLEEVLPGADIYIMNDDGNTLKYLPLRSMEKESEKPPKNNEIDQDQKQKDQSDATKEEENRNNE
ncbi:FtsH protease activity modulator HflK [Lederbergia sp. NSJ-179]|uniref:FtsH protease activity modulator HflK n=1 Tax=Lederbergia sp. NSJ-179 TaxID=2931402 RepID=UPI001FD237DE|nr:FtsH protease activity modulator HflK [Lederbergia sp. NSJ-179]MCJ7839753.1 FtsH protease activity modulator HflK [Lederbergia sp. NSJ-179]